MVESPIDPDPLPCFPLFREQTTCFSWLIGTQRLKQTALISIIFGEAETVGGASVEQRLFEVWEPRKVKNGRTSQPLLMSRYQPAPHSIQISGVTSVLQSSFDCLFPIP